MSFAGDESKTLPLNQIQNGLTIATKPVFGKANDLPGANRQIIHSKRNNQKELFTEFEKSPTDIEDSNESWVTKQSEERGKENDQIVEIDHSPDEAYPKGFKGTVTFHDNSRQSLPYLLPPGHTVAIWKIIAKVIKQDMTKISFPVSINEPVNTLQKSTEHMANYHMIEQFMTGKYADLESHRDTP